ncbi:MAG TPA: HAD family hydrolase [Longimicrobiales bacterium]
MSRSQLPARHGRAAQGWLAAGALAFGATAHVSQDPLPSWNDGPAKRSILAFVAEATEPGGARFVPPDARIAVFDNDGTLWTEQPTYVQSAFTLDRLRALARENPELLRNQKVRDALENGDGGTALSEPSPELIAALAAVYAGMTPGEYERIVSEWLATAKHPRFRRRYTELVYRPMLEVIRYLKANGFRTYIVSGGGQDFMRPWIGRVYGIPPEQVVGSTIEVKYELRNGVPVLVRLPKVDFIDDKEGKPVGIHKFIGRRPVAAFGNSDGDRQMLEYTAVGEGAHLMLLVHHDDCEREYCYDRESRVGRLDAALDEARRRGWTVVSMKRDWRYIYPFEAPAGARPP